MIAILKKAGFFMCNLSAVYFLEYVILTCYADRISNHINKNNPDKKDEYIYANCYVIFNFCYSIGVFLSRSSLSVVTIKRVEILTIL